MEGSESVPMIKDPDPDPGGPKTYGSGFRNTGEHTEITNRTPLNM
jgi:hypothetical protein